MRKLIDCDDSDMQIWASSIMAKNVLSELKEWQTSADKAVHIKLSERAAGQYEAYERVIRLLEGYAG